MSTNQFGNGREKPLRIVAPSIYTTMLETFAEYNIHPYDIQALAVQTDAGIDVTLYFSDTFSHSVSIQVDRNKEDQSEEEMRQFFRDTAERCQKQLIKDYYKMMKP